MATSTASPPLPASTAPASSARSLFVRLALGGILLLILAVWLRLQDPDASPVVAWLIGLCGLAGLGLAVWQAVPLWLQTLPPERKTATFESQRRIIALTLLAGGALLLVVSLYLGFGTRPSGSFGLLCDHFGPAAGLFLFALVTLGAGYRLLQPLREEYAVNLEPVRSVFPLIRFGMFGLAAIALFTFALLSFYYQLGMEYFPELAGLALLGFFFVGVGLWLISTPAADVFTVRIFVLVLGGGVGLILFLVTLGRVWAMRDIAFGGMRAWQGDEAWLLWLCAYLQLVALALMFGSLLLARADIRTNAVLRRVLFGYSTLLNGLLLFEALVILNIVIYTLVPYSFDWTQSRGLHSLANSSKNLLNELKQDAHIFVLLPQHPVYKDVRNLMDNVGAESNKVDIKFVSPDRDTKEYERLAQLFPKILPSAQAIMPGESGRGILVVYGPMPTEEQVSSRYAFIPEKKLFDFPSPHGARGRDKMTRTFKGEVEVMRELNFLVRGQERRKVYFLQGNEELDIAEEKLGRRPNLSISLEPLGAGKLVDRLRKDNFEVQGLSFAKRLGTEKKDLVLAEEGTDKKKEVPKDAYAVVIAGASAKVADDALAALERYLDRGGHMIVLLDVVVAPGAAGGVKTSGIEDWLKKYSIEASDEVVLAYIEQPFESPLTIVATAPSKTENVLAKQFFNRGIQLNHVRAVRPASAPGKYKGDTVLQTVPRVTPAVAEKKLSALRDPVRYFRELESQPDFEDKVSKPVSIAVAVSEGEKPRLVVIGDTDFLSNFSLTASKDADTFYALFSSSLEWMAERGEGLIGPRPKESSTFALGPDVEPNRMILLPGWLMLLSVVGLGLGIWMVRRR